MSVIIMTTTSPRIMFVGRLPCLLCLLLLLLHISTVVSLQEVLNRLQWYTKYDVYPEYCSTIEQMKSRTIPNLVDGNDSEILFKLIGTSKIMHVTTIIRHGSRTPYRSGLNCWDYTKFSIDPIEQVWDCNLTTYLSPPPPDRIYTEEYGGRRRRTRRKQRQQQQEHDEQQRIEHDKQHINRNVKSSTATEKGAMFLFEKKYDGLVISNNNQEYDLGTSNELNGTCQLGQLLLQGYEQEYTNGQSIRNAYFYSSSTASRTGFFSSSKTTSTSNTLQTDTRMQLIDITKDTENNYVWDTLVYRVDDDQRTLMSGQVLLRGMFGTELYDYTKNHNGDYPIIVLHTSDRKKDIVDPNSLVCPRLQEITETVRTNDPKYKEIFVDSMNAQQLHNFQIEILSIPDKTKQMEKIDCLMTTICTDRTIPQPVNDYKGSSANDTNRNTTTIPDEYDIKYGSNRFQRLIDYDTSVYGYIAFVNNGEYSKLGMGPLWYGILEQIDNAINSTSTGNTEVDYKKFYIIAGHDTTILPMLISLGANVWDTIWPYYASMMTIEIHQINLDNTANTTIFTSNYTFRLLYNGNVITKRIDNCYYDLCDINVLYNIVVPFARITNRVQLCERQVLQEPSINDIITESENIVETKNGALIFLLISILMSLCGAITMYMYMKKCNDFKQNTSNSTADRNVIVRSSYDTVDNEPNNIIHNNHQTNNDDDEYDDNSFTSAIKKASTTNNRYTDNVVGGTLT